MTDKLTITKVMGVPIQKEALSRTEKGTLVVTGFFTSDQKDMHGDIITRGATERAIRAYRQWGNIRRMHQPDPVGKVLGIGEEDGLEWNQVKLEVIEPKAIQQVESGLLSALSIGAMIDIDSIEFLDDGGMLINDYLLGEISLVDHPGNYDAALQKDAITGSLRLLIDRFGFLSVGKSMQTILNEETTMSEEMKTKDLEAEVEDAELEEEDTSTEEAETDEAPEEPVADEEVSKEIDAEAEAEEETDEDLQDESDTEEVEDESSTIEEDEITDADEADDISRSIGELSERVDALTSLVGDLAKALLPSQSDIETETEDLDGSDSDIENEADDDAAEIPENAHKSIIPVDDDESQDEEETEVRKSLHETLHRMFTK